MTPPTHAVEDANGTSLSSLPPDRLLVLLAGVSAIGFGALIVVLYAIGEPVPRTMAGFTALGGVVFAFAVAFTFGSALLLAFRTMALRPAEGSILALAFSVVLLAFGGMPGLIAGILGLVGALTGILRNLRFTV